MMMTIEYDQTQPLSAAADKARETSSSAAERPLPLELDKTTPLADTEIRQFSREDADSLIGAQLAHFSVLDTLGGGGMGTVYRARDVALERIVALKVLPEDLNEPELIERFKREARAQARLSHPNVVPIYYIGEQDGRHFFAMELVQGRSLDQLLDEDGPIDWRVALEYMIDVAHALKQAHERGLIHRDLKPGNLLLTPEGRVKVADFGLAKPLEEGADAALTQEGEFMGTPMYIAPEQARGLAVDQRADMYALGATFYHLMTGEPLFSASSVVALLVKHVSEPAPELERPGLQVPSAVEAIFSRLLAKTPEDRFDDYDELLAALLAARPRRLLDAGFLVRSAAGFVDFLILCVLGALSGNLVLLLFPLYLVGSLAWRGSTLGQWLFRLQTRRRDHGELGWKEVLTRVLVLGWAPLIVFGILWGMPYLFGIESIRFENGELGGEGSLIVEVAIVAAITGLVLLWGLGMLLAAFHPRKRSVYDLVSKSKVVYRLGEEG